MEVQTDATTIVRVEITIFTLNLNQIGNNSVHQIKLKIRDSSRMYMVATGSLEEPHICTA